MKLILKDQDDRLDAALAKLTDKLSQAAEAQDAAVSQARAALQASLDDSSAAMHAFTAEAASIIESTRLAIAEKTAEYLGDAAPRLPVATIPPFQLVVAGDGEKVKGHSSLYAMADSVITEAGVVRKGKLGVEGEPSADAPPLTLHESEIREIATANGLDISSGRDVIKAIGFAWARKAAGVDTAATAAVQAAIAPPEEAAGAPIQQAAE